MKAKFKILIGVALVLLISLSIYLVILNKKPELKSIEDINVTKGLEEGTCFKLNDGRTACKLGSVNISGGNISSSNFSVKREK